MDRSQASDSEEEHFEDAVENLTLQSKAGLNAPKKGIEVIQTAENVEPTDSNIYDETVSSNIVSGSNICEVSSTERISDNTIKAVTDNKTPVNTDSKEDKMTDDILVEEKNKLKSETDNDDLNVLLKQDDSSSSDDDSEDTSSNHETETCVPNSEDLQVTCDNSGQNVSDPVEEALGTNPEQDSEKTKEAGEIIIDEESIRQKEALLSEEEREARRKAAQELKEGGNTEFKSANFEAAIDKFTAALAICPMCYAKDRSIMYSNRGACKYRMEKYESSITDSSKALELNPKYLKALLRRAECYEKTDKLDEALEDYNKALEMDPSLLRVREACMRLPEEIKDRNEKMKAEMLGKLKDLGNMVLRPFGLSTNNFQLNQDPNTGGYSVNFTQNADNGDKKS